MRARKPTTGYAMIMARIAVVVIAFVLGHDAMMAANPHVDPVGSHASHVETMVEECTVVEGHVQHASVHALFFWEMDTSAADTIIWLKDLTRASTESVASPPASTSLRIALQVFLN